MNRREGAHPHETRHVGRCRRTRTGIHPHTHTHMPTRTYPPPPNTVHALRAGPMSVLITQRRPRRKCPIPIPVPPPNVPLLAAWLGLQPANVEEADHGGALAHGQGVIERG